MNKFIGELLPALLKTLSDDSDDVVLMNLKVMVVVIVDVCCHGLKIKVVVMDVISR